MKKREPWTTDEKMGCIAGIVILLFGSLFILGTVALIYALIDFLVH